MIRKISKKWIGPIIGLIFLFLAFRNFRYHEFINALSDFNLYYLLPILCIFFLSYFMRGIRWRVILDSVKKISIYNSFSVIFIGQMGNNLLPVRLGEIIRAYVIGNKENISKSASFASIVLERVFDGITLVALMISVTFFLPFPLWVKKIVLISAIVFGMALFFLIICVHKMDRVIDYLKRWFPIMREGNPDKISTFLLRFTSGLRLLRNGKQVTVVFIFSLFIWSCEALIYFTLFKALEIQLPFYSSIFVMGTAALMIAIPSLPGHIGTFHYACMLALAVFGVSKNTSLIYAIILHGIIYVAIVSSGLFFMSRSGLRIGELQGLPSPLTYSASETNHGE